MVKTLDEDISEQALRIHNGMTPANIREEDSVKAEVEINGAWEKVRVWRYTPFGLDFVNEQRLGLRLGDSLRVKIRLGKDVTTFDSLVVNEVYRERDTILVGIKTFRSQTTENLQGDRRQHQRWLCPDDYLPRGRAANPLVYNDFILFRILDVSAGGLKIVTSMRNKLLGKGQRIDTTISLPLVGSVQATFLIIDLKPITIKHQGETKEELMIRVQFIHPDSVFLASIAEYLLNFADGVTLTSLKKDGYPLKTASKWFDFGYVKTKADYEDVLQLRHLAYLAAGKIDQSKKSMDMADEYDDRARILMVKHNGKVVGSLRAMFHSDTDDTDHGRYVKYPASLPKMSEMVECSRICTDPEYRGSDVFYQLMAHLVLTSLKGGRRYVLGGAAGSLIPLYEKCGFKKVGVSYRNAALSGLEHQLILMDTYDVALGKGISMSAWSQIYSGVFQYMVDQELITPSSFDLLRVGMMRSMGKVISGRA